MTTSPKPLLTNSFCSDFFLYKLHVEKNKYILKKDNSADCIYADGIRRLLNMHGYTNQECNDLSVLSLPLMVGKSIK